MSNNRNNHVTQSSSEEDDTPQIESFLELIIFCTGRSAQVRKENPRRSQICHVAYGDVITTWENGTPQMRNIPTRGVRRPHMKTVNRFYTSLGFPPNGGRTGEVRRILDQQEEYADDGVQDLDEDVSYISGKSLHSLGEALFQTQAMKYTTFERYFKERRSRDFKYLGGYVIRTKKGVPNQFIMLVHSPNCHFWSGDVGRFLKYLMTALRWEWEEEQESRRRRRRRRHLRGSSRDTEDEDDNQDAAGEDNSGSHGQNQDAAGEDNSGSHGQNQDAVGEDNSGYHGQNQDAAGGTGNNVIAEASLPLKKRRHQAVAITDNDGNKTQQERDDANNYEGDGDSDSDSESSTTSSCDSNDWISDLERKSLRNKRRNDKLWKSGMQLFHIEPQTPPKKKQKSAKKTDAVSTTRRRSERRRTAPVASIRTMTTSGMCTALSSSSHASVVVQTNNNSIGGNKALHVETDERSSTRNEDLMNNNTGNWTRFGLMKQVPGKSGRNVKKFSWDWRAYPELEDFLNQNREEYLSFSAKNYTIEQRDYNKRLTSQLLDRANESGYPEFKECPFSAVRDRIRSYYKSRFSSTRKRRRERQQERKDRSTGGGPNALSVVPPRIASLPVTTPDDDGLMTTVVAVATMAKPAGSKPWWTSIEHNVLIRGMKNFGQDYDKLATLLPFRTRSAVKYYIQRISKKNAVGIVTERKWREYLMGDIDAGTGTTSIIPRELTSKKRKSSMENAGNTGGGGVSVERQKILYQFTDNNNTDIMLNSVSTTPTTMHPVDANVQQRYEKKKKKRSGKYAPWEVRRKQLANYKTAVGDTNVPQGYEENKQLGLWVKTQRYQYKRLKQGKPSLMTEERIQSLNEIDFLWQGNKKKMQKNSSTNHSVIEWTDTPATKKKTTTIKKKAVTKKKTSTIKKKAPDGRSLVTGTGTTSIIPKKLRTYCVESNYWSETPSKRKKLMRMPPNDDESVLKKKRKRASAITTPYGASI